MTLAGRRRPDHRPAARRPLPPRRRALRARQPRRAHRAAQPRRAGGAATRSSAPAPCATRTPISVLAVDIDEFKALNDSLGHPTGDQVLRQVSAALQPLDPRDRRGRRASAATSSRSCCRAPTPVTRCAVRRGPPLGDRALPLTEETSSVTVSIGVDHARRPDPRLRGAVAGGRRRHVRGQARRRRPGPRSARAGGGRGSLGSRHEPRTAAHRLSAAP